MIRIFITAILYLITMFTQAQETKTKIHEANSQMTVIQDAKESEKKIKVNALFTAGFKSQNLK